MKLFKDKKIVLIIIVFLVLVGGSYGVYKYVLKKPSSNNQVANKDVTKSNGKTKQPKVDEFAKFKDNKKIITDLGLPTDYTSKKEDFYQNEKKELFLEYSISGSVALAKLQGEKWVKVLSWNGYPSCKTFDDAGVPFNKSTIEYECSVNGGPLRASQKIEDQISYCKFHLKKFGNYPNNEIRCKDIVK